MINLARRCRQVWLGWRSWPLFRLTAWIIAIWWLLMVVDERLQAWPSHNLNVGHWITSIRDGLALPLYLTPVALMMAVPMLIVSRLKRQLADWRCTLVPGFRRSHLLVAFVIAVTIFLVMAVLPTALDTFLLWQRSYSWRLELPDHWRVFEMSKFDFAHESVWPAVANLSAALLLVTVVGGIAACASVGLTIAIIMACWMGFALLGWGRGEWYRTMYDAVYDPRLTLGFMAWSILWFLWLWLRLAHVSRGRDAIAADERVPWLGTLLVGRQPSTLADWMHAGRWQRARHRRLMGLGHRFIWIVAVYLALIIALSPLVRPYGPWMERGGYSFSALVVAVITSALAVGLSWPQRLAALGDIELLRPARRDNFAAEIGLAMMYDTAEMFLATLLFMLAPIAFWTPVALYTQPFWSALLAALLSGAMVFGAIVWTLRNRSGALSMAATVLAILTAILLIDDAQMYRRLGPSLIAAAAGVALTADAYRRWRRADML